MLVLRASLRAGAQSRLTKSAEKVIGRHLACLPRSPAFLSAELRCFPILYIPLLFQPTMAHNNSGISGVSSSFIRTSGVKAPIQTGGPAPVTFSADVIGVLKKLDIIRLERN